MLSIYRNGIPSGVPKMEISKNNGEIWERVERQCKGIIYKESKE
jgi:hypothetical protein